LAGALPFAALLVVVAEVDPSCTLAGIETFLPVRWPILSSSERRPG
jgi:hypothetical protein